MESRVLNRNLVLHSFWVEIAEHTHDAAFCVYRREQLLNISFDGEGLITITIRRARDTSEINLTQTARDRDAPWVRTFDDPFHRGSRYEFSRATVSHQGTHR